MSSSLFGILEAARAQAASRIAARERSEAWKSLDVSLLHALLVDPLVAETGRPREEVLSYTRDAREAVAAVREGRASVALLLESDARQRRAGRGRRARSHARKIDLLSPQAARRPGHARPGRQRR